MNDYSPADYSQINRRARTARDFLVIFFRRRWVVLGVSLPIIVVSIMATMKTADVFTARTQVMIEARSVDNPSFKPAIVEYDILMSAAVEIAQSIPVAERAAEALIDSLPRFQFENSLLNRVRSKEDLVGVILTGVNCGQVGESNILSITFSYRYPDFALMAVQALADAFMGFYIDSQKNPQAIEYYSDQIREVEGEIDSLMVLRVDIYNREGLNAVESNNSAGIQQMRQMEYSYFQARMRRLGLGDKYEGILREIEINPDFIPALSSVGENMSLSRSSGVLEEAKLDLARLRQSYHDSSEFVLRQLEYVEQTRLAFRQLQGSFLKDLKISYEVALAEEQALKEALDSYQADLVVFPKLGKKLEHLDMQIDSQKLLLESLHMKKGEVRLKAQSDQRISSVTPLNSPSIDFGVSGGKKFLYLLFAIIFALVLGLVVAMAFDIQDHRIFDRRQAEKVLEVNVLGSISHEKLPEGE